MSDVTPYPLPLTSMIASMVTRCCRQALSAIESSTGHATACRIGALNIEWSTLGDRTDVSRWVRAPNLRVSITLTTSTCAVHHAVNDSDGRPHECGNRTCLGWSPARRAGGRAHAGGRAVTRCRWSDEARALAVTGKMRTAPCQAWPNNAARPRQTSRNGVSTMARRVPSSANFDNKSTSPIEGRTLVSGALPFRNTSPNR